MAKFKVGDKVKDKSRLYMGAAKIVDETDDGYVIKFDSGPRDMVDEEWLVAANASCNATATDVVRSTNAVVRNALAAQNATMGEIKAQLNPAKIKEAYQQLRNAADGLERCIPALKASNIAKAWPRTAEMYGEARSKLNNLLMQFEGELQDMIR